MRGLRRILSRGGRRRAETLQLTRAELRAESGSEPVGPVHAVDADLSREVALVAEYVLRLRREVRALRARELGRERLPVWRRELDEVEATMRAAAERIMAATEALIDTGEDGGEYRALVERQITGIVEACSFPDIVGQQLGRLRGEIGAVEARLERFANATRVPDGGESFDRAALVREVRRDVLLVEGPQAAGAGVEQGEVDKLFG